jgi:hypothetical protein
MHSESDRPLYSEESLRFQQMAADRAVETFPTDEDQQISVMMEMDAWTPGQKRAFMIEKEEFDLKRMLTEARSRKRKRQEQECSSHQPPATPSQGWWPSCALASSMVGTRLCELFIFAYD